MISSTGSAGSRRQSAVCAQCDNRPEPPSREAPAALAGHAPIVHLAAGWAGMGVTEGRSLGYRWYVLPDASGQTAHGWVTDGTCAPSLCSMDYVRDEGLGGLADGHGADRWVCFSWSGATAVDDAYSVALIRDSVNAVAAGRHCDAAAVDGVWWISSCRDQSNAGPCSPVDQQRAHHRRSPI